MFGFNRADQFDCLDRIICECDLDFHRSVVAFAMSCVSAGCVSDRNVASLFLTAFSLCLCERIVDGVDQGSGCLSAAADAVNAFG